ncbi:MAG: hypothetical protein M1826_005476 [Phylliscum demangeonii]|nr:MAG: hypothetical protein M1826_005476 [Phylliscum demangeonii]
MDAAASSPPPPILSAFPSTPEQFAADARISFSKPEQKWMLEADDGSEYEYDAALKRWLPLVDEALMRAQAAVYAVPGVDEHQPAGPAGPAASAAGKRKRKNEGGPGRGPHKKAKATTTDDDGDPAPAPPARKNTAVYVTNLPPDTTMEEVQAVFGRCGVIAEEIDQGRARIKVYRDAQGRAKGDALVVYFRAESVALAVQMLDDTPFRRTEAGSSGPMHVQPADFSYKQQQAVPGAAGDGAGKSGAGGKASALDKKKIIRKTKKLNSKLADWDDDDPATHPDLAAASKWDKVVVLKHLFTRAEVEADPASILDIKEDIRDECAKLGPVTNVVLYDREPDGVATVRFAAPEAAAACVQLMHGRWFSGARIEAYVADGSERFRQSEKRRQLFEPDADVGAEAGDGGGGGGGNGGGEAEGGRVSGGGVGDEEARRLDRFGSWLEGDAA